MHGGAGGIGNVAVQLGAALGARVFATAGSPEKQELCVSLGAERAISYRDEDFVEVLGEAGGADVILDNMGAKYLGRNVAALATEGRLVIIGMQGGVKGELDINGLLRKRGAVIATSLRARPDGGEGRHLRGRGGARLAALRQGAVRSFVHEEVPLAEAGARPRADGVRRAQRQDPARRRAVTPR